MLISLYENVKFLHFICLLEFSYISEFRLPSSLERSELGTRKNFDVITVIYTLPVAKIRLCNNGALSGTILIVFGNYFKSK